VHKTTIHHCGHGPHLVDVVAIDFEQVSISHDEIGSLAHFDGAQLIGAPELERGVPRVTVDAGVEAEAFAERRPQGCVRSPLDLTSDIAGFPKCIRHVASFAV
jgi:hypothetical protein